MQAEAYVDHSMEGAYKAREMHLGANWFFWVAIASAAHSLIVYYFAIGGMSFGLGMNHYVDSKITFASLDGPNVLGLLVNLCIALVVAGFGYLAWRGSDVAFIVGMFLYVVDLVVALGYREFWGASIHLLVLFFMFKGLLASRRRYDPSVDATGS